MMKSLRSARLALLVAPLLALGACDQIGKIIEQLRGESAVISLEDVPPEARSIGGAALRPADTMAESLKPQPVLFVPGEIIVGAKLEQTALAQAARALNLPLTGRLTADGLTEGVPEQIEEAAMEAVGAAARKSARTVLARMGIEGDITIDESGVVTIDLTPDETASPTSLRFAQAAAGEAAPAEGPAPDGAPAAADASAIPEVAVETDGQKCPRGITPQQLDAADLTVQTICAVERLEASRKFDYVEKNYVLTIDFDLLPTGRPAPKAPPATTPAGTGTAQTPAAPAAPVEQAATGVRPNDPLLLLQWGFLPRGSGAGMSPGGAGFETYWSNARQVGSKAVRVAVIDTGIDMSHPDIKASPNLGRGIDLVQDPERAGDGDGVDRDANDPGDACGPGRVNSFHGTHVAGTVGAAATNDRRGVAGGAWNVTVVPVRAIGRCGGELDNIIDAIRWSAGLIPARTDAGELLPIEQPVDIINMSLSVGVPCPESMQRAIDQAVAKGVVIVVAAGNKSMQVSSYAPANCQNVIVVAANDARGQIAFYSNFGPEVDILAPGGDVFNDTDGDGRPDGILSTKTTTQDCYDPETRQAAATCYYGYEQGTSMAAPHVAAALALLKSETQLRGQALEDLLFARALGPIDENAQCAIDCARNPNATPIPGLAGRCIRACGRGMLDLARAVQSSPGPAAGGGGR